MTSRPSIVSIDADNGWLIGYDQNSVRVLGGAAAAADSSKTLVRAAPADSRLSHRSGYVMNTRSLRVVALQEQLGRASLAQAALAATAASAGRRRQKHYFHVEAGHDDGRRWRRYSGLADIRGCSWRLSGGNPGATLAGSLSTATHGAEFNTDRC